ncbi:MAG: glycosyltransferase family 4 protein, partial [Treponema sp.]|nr:glycosyltransferase family 4 protein [Treponema sp.]
DPEKLARISSPCQNTEIVDCHTIKPFSIRELCAFPHTIVKQINKTSLFYSPYFNIPAGITIPVYTTIHDIIFPDMPELTSPHGLAARMWFYRRAFRRSKKIFTVSEFSKSRIRYYLGSGKPVVVTYNAAQSYLLEPFSYPPEKKDIILFIGNIKKHKGLSCLLDAFLKARNEGLNSRLVIAGGMENFRSRDSDVLRRVDSLDKEVVEFTGFIPNEKLKSLLAEAALLVQPSLYEGFGYPPLEAMMVGTSALISDIPVFREVYGSFPVTFFKAGDSGDLKEKLLFLLRDQKYQGLTLPQELVEKYSFKKTAGIILKELEKS